MNKLIWLTLVLGISAQAKTFDCGGDGESVRRATVTVHEDDTVFLTEVMRNGETYTSEFNFVEKSYGDFVYEKQRSEIKFRRDVYGQPYFVSLSVDGEFQSCH